MANAVLTEKTAKGLKTPGRYTAGGGLSLVITATGTRSWVLRFQQDGKRVDRGLGGYPAISLREAVDKAGELKARLRRHGLHAPKPVKTAPAAREGRSRLPTFEAMARKCHQSLVKTGRLNNPKGQRNWLDRAQNHLFPVIGKLPIDEVTTPLLLDNILEDLATEKAETARRLQIIVSQTFDYAIGRERLPLSNPTLRISQFYRQAKHTPMRALDYSEVPAAMELIAGSRNYPRRKRPWPVTLLGIMFMVFTASRPGEVRGATWDEVDFDLHLDKPGGVWTIPASKMKMGKEHRVPLSWQARLVLIEAMADDTHDPAKRHIFSNPVADKPLADNSFLNFLQREGVHCTAHGFRSSFRVWAAEQTDASYEAAELALAHQIGDHTTRAYLRTDLLDQRRPLMQAWADYVWPETLSEPW